MTRNPWKEAFLGSSIKYILIACVVLIGQGVVGTRVSSGRRTFCSRFPRWPRWSRPTSWERLKA